MTSVLHPNLPENRLIVLLGASGVGKSTLAVTGSARIAAVNGARHHADLQPSVRADELPVDTVYGGLVDTVYGC
ncbi:hypothetical protein ACFZC7_28275 [Streptomyces massasporeus]|uniref:hypothetical protein n=1 Tax=Streptomyces massasporeus TaxID=67324 RepID=UPI0036ED6611